MYWNKKALLSLLIPGGAIFLIAWIGLGTGLVAVSPPAVHFYYYAAFAAGMLLAWRFHSSKVLFALLFLLLGHHAVEFFSAARIMASGPGRIAFEAAAFLLPLNFVALSLVRERGLGLEVIASRLGLLFVQSVFVAVICRAGERTAPALFRAGLLPAELFSWSRVPQISVLLFLARARFARDPLPALPQARRERTILVISGSLAGDAERRDHAIAIAYIATAGVILASSIVEASYALAYNDELTTLPSRRAFNESTLRLAAPYSLAVVDIDHFKNFNDTYGHDTGDQVLRMVASKLGEVTGGGKAFRTGGEEFCILFSGKSVAQALPHLEALRKEVETAIFHLRSAPVAVLPPQDDRRKPSKKSSSRSRPAAARGGELSVTVSIGVAEARTPAQQPEQVLRVADKALYRAKQAGRNRVETASPARLTNCANRQAKYRLRFSA